MPATCRKRLEIISMIQANMRRCEGTKEEVLQVVSQVQTSRYEGAETMTAFQPGRVDCGRRRTGTGGLNITLIGADIMIPVLV
jgi:hypothetical protein